MHDSSSVDYRIEWQNQPAQSREVESMRKPASVYM